MSETAIDNGSVNVAIEDGIARITFYHPKSNSLPGTILKQLAEAITEAGKNDDAKVIIVKSKGDRAFCAGASFDELIAIENETEGKEFFMGFARVINAMRTVPKFVIGRAQGKAVGGGVGVISACDYAFASIESAVKLSELAIGIGPFVVGPAVERKIGTSAFSQLAVNATAWQSAEWAFHKGLYNEVFTDLKDMDKAIFELAQKLSKSSPEAMALLKKAMWNGTEDWDTLLEERAVMSGHLVLSDFTRNAINAFKNK
ncbi:MAG: enoyl-CoA hydratase/isomerase family protein [Bacteroidia bacterium]|nr:enoyl-CoA hydratase/isomerase family protein [Bacteroidia bacterium]NNM15869.1 enoyl-CoA hydratase/isomerase family protein [Bacteroidia bacterium]